MTRYLYKDEYTSNLPLSPLELSWAVRDCPRSILNGTEKGVLQALISRGISIYPSLNVLSEDSGFSRRTVQDTIAKLKDKGWLSVVSGDGRTHTSNRYTVTVPGCYQRTVTKTDSGRDIIRIIYPPRAGDALGLEQEMPQPRAGDAPKEEIEDRNKRITVPDSEPSGSSPGTVIDLEEKNYPASNDTAKQDLVPPGKDRYFYSEDKHTYRKAGSSKPRPREKQVFLTEDEYDRAMGWNGRQDLDFMRQFDEPSKREIPRQRPALDELLEVVRQNELEHYE